MGRRNGRPAVRWSNVYFDRLGIIGETEKIDTKKNQLCSTFKGSLSLLIYPKNQPFIRVHNTSKPM